MKNKRTEEYRILNKECKCKSKFQNSLSFVIYSAVLAILVCVATKVQAQQTADPSSFAVRGVLPWHNFLSGPTAWNAEDYQAYLDWCQEQGINLIAFHNYTGGGERYVNYVEPMIRIQYKNVLPYAEFDHSGTARWGYLPMKVEDFAFRTSELYDLPAGATYFGADAALLPENNEERYEHAQKLMKQVLEMVHERNMQMAMGFEFGVAPPEYASIRTSQLYWPGSGSLIYNPFDPDAIGILHATIDDILNTYKGIDQIWLWLNEHTMFGVDVESTLEHEAMAGWFEENSHYFEGEDITESMQFLGVWAQAYILKAYEYIKQQSPETKVVISGWGSRAQLTPLLGGLHEALPADITFSILSPGQGEYPHPEGFKEISKTREVWAIPWLEGDRSLWHLQPRVDKLRSHVKAAAEDNLDGVIGIHWRTEEIRPNFEAFTHFAREPSDTMSTESFYHIYYQERYGLFAADRLSAVMAQLDREEIFEGIPSPEYFAYKPGYGRLNDEQARAFRNLIDEIGLCLEKESDKHYVSNLKWLKATIKFALLLDEVGRRIEPAWQLRSEVRTGQVTISGNKEQFRRARENFEQAPIREMFEVFAKRVRSRGELGELSSLNQRVWREYQLLETFLRKELESSDE